MNEAYICDAIRTPVGRYAGALKDVRADDLGAVDLELRYRFAIEAFDEQQIARRHATGQIRQRGLGRAAQLVHERPAARRGDEDFGAARFPMPEGILARLVDLESVMRVLDQ